MSACHTRGGLVRNYLNHSSCCSQCVIGAVAASDVHQCQCILSIWVVVVVERATHSAGLQEFAVLSVWSWRAKWSWQKACGCGGVNCVFVLMLTVTSNWLTSVSHHLIQLEPCSSTTCSVYVWCVLTDEGKLLYTSAPWWFSNMSSVIYSFFLFHSSICRNVSKLNQYTVGIKSASTILKIQIGRDPSDNNITHISMYSLTGIYVDGHMIQLFQSKDFILCDNHNNFFLHLNMQFCFQLAKICRYIHTNIQCNI